MGSEVSPGVERAEARANDLAAQRGGDATLLGDWLLALLEDDEAKPAVVVTSLGIDLAAVRDALGMRSFPAASPGDLYETARQKGLFLRSDAAVTTDLLLLAVLEAGGELADFGVTAAAVEAMLAAGSPRLPDVAFEAAEEFHVPEPTELVRAARVLDANANRARESLRVIDDYCRFVLDDALLTGEVKRLRHDLAAAVEALPRGPMLAARDTTHDVGTAIAAAGEYDRTTAGQVARVNFARLQECLRSLEEYSKILSDAFARRVEAIRYEVYTLERAVLLGTNSRERLQHARLYALLTASQCVTSLEWTIAEAAEGGVDVVQLREKSLSDRELIARAKDVRRWTRAAGVLFVVNDRPDVAALCHADGVHLGQDDLGVAEARRVVGADALIGVSTHTAEQVRRAVLDGADYIGVGPTFPSKTKPFDAFPGLDFVREVVGLTTLPAFALGGIDVSNVGEVVAAGISRVAVSSAIATADEPKAVAMQLRFRLGRLPGRLGELGEESGVVKLGGPGG